MDYFEVTFANGKNVIAYNAPESYLKSYLTNTNAAFKQVNESRAKEINQYYKFDELGWQLLYLHALEAKEEKVMNLVKFNASEDDRLSTLFNNYHSLKNENTGSSSYFEIILANGTYVMAYNAPESYVKGCLVNTGALCRQSNEDRAKTLNNYCDVNTHEGQQSLRIRALEAQSEIKNGLILTSIFNNSTLKELFPNPEEFQKAAEAMEDVCPTSQQFDKTLESYKRMGTQPKQIKDNIQRLMEDFNNKNKTINFNESVKDSFIKKFKKKLF